MKQSESPTVAQEFSLSQIQFELLKTMASLDSFLARHTRLHPIQRKWDADRIAYRAGVVPPITAANAVSDRRTQVYSQAVKALEELRKLGLVEVRCDTVRQLQQWGITVAGREYAARKSENSG